MKIRLFFGGLLVGVAIGKMVGGAVVKVSAEETGKRQYPPGPCSDTGVDGRYGGWEAHYAVLSNQVWLSGL